MTYIVGVDVGYSNLKIVVGDSTSDRPKKEFIMPAGAGPAEKMPSPISGADTSGAGISVLIDGEKWAVGVEPGRLQGHERALDRRYTQSNQYRALFYGALASAEMSHIDHVVTGLPVSLHADRDLRDGLTRLLTGHHQISGDRAITVDRVSVIPQPVGAYMDLMIDFQDVDLIDKGRILILDPGFFSLDWVIVEAGEVRTAFSNSSYSAISKVLEVVHDRIQVDHDARVGVAKLECALRHGESEIYARGKKINFNQYLCETANEVLAGAMQAVQRSMRTEDRDVDLILIAGGGARIIEPVVRSAFPGAQVVIPADPVLANARGFWFYGI